MATYPDIGLQPHAEKMKEIAHAGWATRCCGAAASGTPAAAVVDRYRPFVCVADFFLTSLTDTPLKNMATYILKNYIN